MLRRSCSASGSRSRRRGAYVLRVESLFGRAPGAGPEKGSVADIVRTLVAGGSPKVFEDRTVSPTCILDAARATRQLLEATAAPGLYHCVNTGRCTWFELAQEIARQLGEPQLEARLVPVRVSEVTLKAKRPQFCALANDKLRAAGIDMPAWQDALARYLDGRASAGVRRRCECGRSEHREVRCSEGQCGDIH